MKHQLVRIMAQREHAERLAIYYESDRRSRRLQYVCDYPEFLTPLLLFPHSE